MKLTGMWRSLVWNNSEERRSGETYRNLISPKYNFQYSENLLARQSCVDGFSQDVAGLEMLNLILHQRNEWSYHNADALWARAGTWKVMDLPPPVGIRPRVSSPRAILSMMSRCMPRKSGYPNMYVVFLDIYLPF